MSMEEELASDLTTELEISDKNFNAILLTSKIKNALRDVIKARRYPTNYTKEQIEKDLQNYYSNCREIALYDYNKVGIDFENSHSENSVSANFSDRNNLFAGIIPFSKV